MNGLLLALILPLTGTILGSSFVFLMKSQMSHRVQKTLLGFASGVMIAASVWSLLIPGMNMSDGEGWQKVAPVTIGFLCGMTFLLLLDQITPHLHLGDSKPEGLKSRLSRTTMLSLAVTLHNLPEGMAVGAVIAGSMHGNVGISITSAIAMSLGIAVQNIPEGAIISMPMYAEGNSRLRSFALGTLSGIVEPAGAIAVILLASAISPTMPYLLSFAAGAMIYVVVEELIPEASEGEHSNLSTIGFGIGFALMMVLDVVLG